MSGNSLDSTFGALIIGLVIGSILFGLTTLQTHLYFSRFTDDPKWIKRLVALVWAVDALHVALCVHGMYWYLITNFGNNDVLGDEVWSFALQTDCNGLVGMLVELFFARRVYKMSGNWLLATIICIFALIHFSLGIYFTLQAFLLQEVSRFVTLKWVTSVGLGSAAAADILIAVSLVYSLQRARTGIQRTDNIITTLLCYAVTTGATTSIVATTCVILFAFMPTNFIWLSFFWILGKLYANSLLANLNNREELRGRSRNTGDSVIIPLSNLHSSNTPSSPGKKNRRGSLGPGHCDVKVTTHQETRTDPYENREYDKAAQSV